MDREFLARPLDPFWNWAAAKPWRMTAIIVSAILIIGYLT